MAKAKKLSMKQAEKKLGAFLKKGGTGKIAGYKSGKGFKTGLVLYTKKGRTIEEIS